MSSKEPSGGPRGRGKGRGRGRGQQSKQQQPRPGAGPPERRTQEKTQSQSRPSQDTARERHNERQEHGQPPQQNTSEPGQPSQLRAVGKPTRQEPGQLPQQILVGSSHRQEPGQSSQQTPAPRQPPQQTPVCRPPTQEPGQLPQQRSVGRSHRQEPGQSSQLSLCSPAGTPIQKPGQPPQQRSELPLQTPASRKPPQQSLTTHPSRYGPPPNNYHGKKQPPNRPGFGTKGRKIVVRSNFFPMKLPQHLTIHHYDVSIGPGDKLPKWLSRKIYGSLETKYSDTVFQGQKAAFDGSKNVYCSKPLKLVGDKMLLPIEIPVDEEENVHKFNVTLQFVTTMNIDMDRIQALLSESSGCMPLIQAMDVIMRHVPSMKMEPVGRSFFALPPNPFILGQGLEVWPGHYQSIRPTMGWKFKLNLDTSSTAFYTAQPVVDFMCTLLKKGRDAANKLTPEDYQKFTHRPLSDAERMQFAKGIVGLKIKVTHLPYPRKYNVVAVTRNTAKDQMFPLDNGKKMSVRDYFREKYHNFPLSYPHLPCLHVGQKSKNVYIPLEFCEIVGGQRCTKKLNEQQTSQMIRCVTKGADERERMILQKFSNSNISDDPVLKEFGISVDKQMVKVSARVLDPPSLTYGNGSSVVPQKNKGAWDMQSSTKFFTGAEVKGYAVLVCSTWCDNQSVKNFITLLEKKGREMGMTFNSRPLIESYNPRRDSIETIFKTLHDKVNLIIAVIDKGEVYQEIKRIGNTTAAGVATQCVKSDTVNRKCNPSTVANICLKINAKLGGVNQIIEMKYKPPFFLKEPVIIFGADVTHPRAGDTSSPSIAAVVASMDCTSSRFQAKHHLQKHRQEIIEDLQEMTKQLLVNFYRASQAKPTRIIFYRDGVSEGQFEEVRYREIGAIQQACSSLEKDYQPRITFLVVQKRHHTRFFPVNPHDREGRGKNVPPGTTVEHEITHPNEYDFYLCSHAAIQGTSRPCHYHILWDDNDFTADDIQTLSYQLCHTFWRCNRSVSYPAPAYYAHHVAAHARVLLSAQEESQSSDGSSIVSRYSSQQSMAENERAITIDPSRAKHMYFL